ncbi:ubiquitin-conjugating enzyme E2 G1 [Fonticula alba]|uniref:E2 ubiquitin-conjugating enzyme n=1 Tax=Fonticula alba TaxID=691883 RepID=A0A058Z5J3_FONAL|nr:ubiquitin-conjugating enzyme E2 G1 [Fonticula alba]KCV69213.1 ubiquitin-conjugating enzyme E2 G1 [Fonticula alba]|eukprot:XP_009496784.1 ubiquitin-conjugating enzyme E2 G1 [Fonticula alba]
MTQIPSALILRKELQELMRDPVEGFSAGLADDSDLYEWDVTVMGPPDTYYEGGLFRARLSFPRDYPDKPPVLRFKSEMYHPNVYPNGLVCISILHAPGEDENGYEDASERWNPVQNIRTVMLSVISMMSSPNDESPANVDAAKEWRDNRDSFRRRVSQVVRRSQEE